MTQSSLSEQEFIAYSVSILKLLGKHSNISMAYTLWMSGFKQYETVDEEQIEETVDSLLATVREMYISTEGINAARGTLRNSILSQLEPKYNRANRRTLEQTEFIEILRTLSDFNLINFSMTNKTLWLTNRGREFVRNNTRGTTRKFLGKVVQYVAKVAETAAFTSDDENNETEKAAVENAAIILKTAMKHNRGPN